MKKIFSILLAAGMMMVVACGEDGDKNTDNTTQGGTDNTVSVKIGTTTEYTTSNVLGIMEETTEGATLILEASKDATNVALFSLVKVSGAATYNINLATDGMSLLSSLTDDSDEEDFLGKINTAIVYVDGVAYLAGMGSYTVTSLANNTLSASYSLTCYNLFDVIEKVEQHKYMEISSLPSKIITGNITGIKFRNPSVYITGTSVISGTVRNIDAEYDENSKELWVSVEKGGKSSSFKVTTYTGPKDYAVSTNSSGEASFVFCPTTGQSGITYSGTSGSIKITKDDFVETFGEGGIHFISGTLSGSMSYNGGEATFSGSFTDVPVGFFQDSEETIVVGSIIQKNIFK